MRRGLLIDKSEIRFISKQLGVNVEGRFRKWKANIVFLPKDLAKSKAEFEIDLGSIDLASDESETEIRVRSGSTSAKFPVAHFASTSIKNLGGDRYEIAGKLTLKGHHQGRRGAGRAQEGCDRQQRRGRQLSVEAHIDYKIGEGMWADTEMVANDVVVRVRMVLPPVA